MLFNTILPIKSIAQTFSCHKRTNKKNGPSYRPYYNHGPAKRPMTKRITIIQPIVLKIPPKVSETMRRKVGENSQASTSSQNILITPSTPYLSNLKSKCFVLDMCFLLAHKLLHFSFSRFHRDFC